MNLSSQQPEISIVSPVYQAEQLLDELLERCIAALSELHTNFEIILVDDGSTDQSWEKIEKHCQLDSRVKGLKLSRNFGQHQAVMAGLTKAKGYWIVVMDCDLQDQPEAIPHLYRKAQAEEAEVVFARRLNRQDKLLKKWNSKVFYKLLSYLTDVQLDNNIANFGIYHRSVVNSVLQFGERKMVFPLMVRIVGFTQTILDVEHGQRSAGKSSYSFSKQVHLATDIILSFSDKPLRLTMKLGLLIASFAFLFGLYNFYKYMAGIITVPGYASLIISIWFLAGIIIFLLGLIGLYVGKTFEKANGGPSYILQKSLNTD